MDRELFIKDHGLDPEVIFLDEDFYDEAIIGTDANTGVLVYSYSVLVEQAMLNMGISYEDAAEHIDYNVLGSINQSGGLYPKVVHLLEKC